MKYLSMHSLGLNFMGHFCMRQDVARTSSLLLLFLNSGILSPQGMVDKARERGVYDALAVAELVAHLHAIRAQQDTSGGAQLYDLLLAADVFVYIGEGRARRHALVT